MTGKKKAQTHLFIDTNVLLGFFAFAQDDIKELEKLVSLIEAGHVKLYLTQQVVDEFYRNREVKLSESITNFHPLQKGGCPKFMHSLDEYKDYKTSLSEFEKAFNVLTKRAKESANSRTLLADALFERLVGVAGVTKAKDEAYESAVRRSNLGNPPGKSGSIGDGLNWEVLLNEASGGVDLHLISKDGDYASKLNPKEARGFLIDEWKTMKRGSLYLYEYIGQFFERNYPGDNFLLQAEKREAIERLIKSGNFANTHSAIEVISRYIPLLTGEEAEEVIQGCLSNSQIAWIVSDADVESFLIAMLERHGGLLSVSLRTRLKEALGIQDAVEPSEPVFSAEDIDDSDVPF
ncbi:MAG: PIN domain-containing protein [Terracidiphilus sp.]